MENNKSLKDTSGVLFIKQIAAIAATECFGVVGISKKKPVVNRILSQSAERLSHGVEVTYLKGEDKIYDEDTDEIIIDIYVIMEFGLKLISVAENLIDTIKYNVERETDAKVRKVNVHVNYVRVL
ncbi:MAG: Asp23/Gls24 family envelope stress response protein [Anaerofustis stercorihominis]|nr:Asp23/Gls24 family envelope stress response protein [Anaerofustis stercorihominis]